MKRSKVTLATSVGLLIWGLGTPTADSIVAEPPSGLSSPSTGPSAKGTEGLFDCYCIASPEADSDRAARETSGLNLLGIRYARGNGVKRNPRMAMRLFLRSALRGYTPAMANLGTLYGTGALGPADYRQAYAWVRAALFFGVPEEDHDATVTKLGMIAAQLHSGEVDRSEEMAEAIAARVVNACNCSPRRETELAVKAAFQVGDR